MSLDGSPPLASNQPPAQNEVADQTTEGFVSNLSNGDHSAAETVKSVSSIPSAIDLKSLASQEPVSQAQESAAPTEAAPEPETTVIAASHSLPIPPSNDASETVDISAPASVTDSAIAQPTSGVRSEIEAEAPPAETIAAATASPSTEPVHEGTHINGSGVYEREPLTNGILSEAAPAATSSSDTPLAASASDLAPRQEEVISSMIESSEALKQASPIAEAPIVPPAPISAPEAIPPPPVVPLPLVTDLLQKPALKHLDSATSSIIAQPSTPSSPATSFAAAPVSSASESQAAPVSTSAPTSSAFDSFINEQYDSPAPAAPESSFTGDSTLATAEPVSSQPTPTTEAATESAAPEPAPTPVDVALPSTSAGFAPPAPPPAVSQDDVQMSDGAIASTSSVGSPVLKRSAEDSNGPASTDVDDTSDERDAKRMRVEQSAGSIEPPTSAAEASLPSASSLSAIPAAENSSTTSPATSTSAAGASHGPSPTPQPVLGYDPSAFTHVASLPHNAVAQQQQASQHVSTMSPTEMHQPQFAASSSSTVTSVPQTPALQQPPVASTSSVAPAAATASNATTDEKKGDGPLPIITKEQQKWALGVVRLLKKNKNVGPFLRPVDPVALLIPDYFRVITRPMDLGTVESKLNQTGKAMTVAAKAGRTFGIDYTRGTGAWEGASDKVYRTADEFKEDVMRIWENCFRYNGTPDKNPVSAMAAALQEMTEKEIKRMPAAPLIEYVEPPPAPAPVQVEKKERRASQSFVPTIRRSEDGSRPKREIHAPARELPYLADAAEQQSIVAQGGGVNKSRTGRVSGKTAQEQLRFCKEVIKELFKKVHEPYAYVFYEPVNYIALNIPQYPQIVKKPMDLGTVRTKLESGQYAAAPYASFESDVRLIFKNCYAFNPVGTPVNDWGHRLEMVFEQKWAERPMQVAEEEEVSDDDGISVMEKQLQMMQANLEMMKQQKRAEKESARMMQAMEQMQAGFAQRPPKPSKKPSQERRQSGSAGPKKARNSGGGVPKKKKSKRDQDDMYDAPSPPIAQPESVTFEMKRELAVKIVSFEGENLEKAIDIIRQGRPDLLSDANKEIELDIDQLDQRTLLALYRFVCPPAPRAKGRKQTGSGGPSKRKNLDEVKESERIEALEARLRDFESGGASRSAGPSANQPAHDVASSDSSSDEDSGSESDED